jgi:hypothetical protein
MLYNMRVERCKKTTPRGDTRFRWQSVARSFVRSSDIIIMNYDITNLENGLGYRASRTADVHLLKANVLQIV